MSGPDLLGYLSIGDEPAAEPSHFDLSAEQAPISSSATLNIGGEQAAEFSDLYLGGAEVPISTVASTPAANRAPAR